MKIRQFIKSLIAAPAALLAGCVYQDKRLDKSEPPWSEDPDLRRLYEAKIREGCCGELRALKAEFLEPPELDQPLASYCAGVIAGVELAIARLETAQSTEVEHIEAGMQKGRDMASEWVSADGKMKGEDGVWRRVENG